MGFARRSDRLNRRSHQGNATRTGSFSIDTSATTDGAYGVPMATATAPDGSSIHFDVHGDGPTVLLVHGITEQSGCWAPIVERLATDHRVVTMDLRGHGRSDRTAPYDLATMVGDVAAVIAAAGGGEVDLIGHSLGGAVVSAAAGALPVRSVVNVDQSLQLDAFQEQLQAAAPMLRDPETFPAVIGALFDDMAGTALSEEERARIESFRAAEQDVVLGVWHDVIESDPADLRALVEATAAAISAPYLNVFGIDPGDDYADWFAAAVPSARTEVWAGLGHYPHLVEPDRFVATARSFWGR